MHVQLDTDLCQAYGNCMLAAPEVFELDDSTPVVRIVQVEPAPALKDVVEEAVLSCPVQALTLVDP